jgi:Holliday junction resolvase
MLTEKQIENKIKHLLADQGAYYFKHFGCKFSKVGVPDIIACINGRFLAIEVKREDGKVSEIQKFNLEQIRRAGGIAIVARSVGDVKECLNFINTNKIT